MKTSGKGMNIKNNSRRKGGCVDQACAKQNHQTSHKTSEECKKTKT